MVDSHQRAIRELMALRAHFRDFFERALLPSSPLQAAGPPGFEPAVDVWEDDAHLVVEIEVPGVSPDDLGLRLEGSELVVTGELEGRREEGTTYLRLERPRGRFCRRIRLPVPVRGGPEAALNAGVLSVRMTKTVGRRRIPVEQEGAQS
jgi:HSP20 family protein